MKPGWGVRVRREEDTAWQGTREMVKPLLIWVMLRWPGDRGNRTPLHSLLLPWLLPTSVSAALRLLEPAFRIPTMCWRWGGMQMTRTQSSPPKTQGTQLWKRKA